MAAAAPVPAPAGASPPAERAAPDAAWMLHAPHVLYPAADPATAPQALGAGWLILVESPTPQDPLSGDPGRLLDNMLRALQLHRHPRVVLAALQRVAPGQSTDGLVPMAPGLADAIAHWQPAMVLLLGLGAARAALGRTDPLGRLRAEPHQIHGTPAVVTYDPAFLLRSQESKAAAWADLCRALATVRPAPPR